MITRFRLHFLAIVGFLALSSVGHGCRCGTDPEVPEAPKTGVAGLPDDYPTSVSNAADELGTYLPGESDAVVLVSSYAALVALTDTIKAWGIVDPEQMDGIFASLERYHGINPGRADSWVGNGFALDGGLAVGRYAGSWFAVTRVGDRASFDAFVDGLINEEYGRPRARESEHDGVSITSVNVLKRDLVSIAYIDDVAILVAGERAVPDSPSSEESIAALLDARKTAPLASSAGFAAMLERVGESGLVMFYTSQGNLAAQLVAPVVPKNATLETAFGAALGDDLTGFGLALGADDDGLLAKGFVEVGGETLQTIRTLATPDPIESPNLARFVTSDVTGVARFTFAPEPAEKAVLALLEPKAAKEWVKLKGQLNVPFLVSFQDEVLYNLGGQVLFTLFEVQRDALVPGEDLLQVARSGTRAAIYLTMRDKAVGNGFFGKVNALKDLVSSMIPEGKIAFEDVDGTLVVTLKDGRDDAAYVAYRDGVLAAMTPEPETRERVLGLLREPADAAVPQRAAFIDDELLGDGAVIGLAIDASQVVGILSARYDVVEMQINRFLAPLDTLALRLDVGEAGIGLDLRIGLTEPPPAEEGETEQGLE